MKAEGTVKRLVLGALGLSVAALSSVLMASSAVGARSAAPPVDLSSPTRHALSAVTLHESTVMQSFAYDDVHDVWMVLQLMQEGRFHQTAQQHLDQGDLTLNEVSPSGELLGFMYLHGFGHGLTLGLEPSAAATYVWTETSARHEGRHASALAGSYGTKVARFRWRPSAELRPTSAAVSTYSANSGLPEESPVVDHHHNRIAIEYYSTYYRKFRWALYPLDRFKRRDFTPIRRSTWPAALGSITDQGWAYANDTTMINYNGTAYSSSNPTGNATLFQVSIATATGKIVKRSPITSGARLVSREPEGITLLGRSICLGFASGRAGERRAEVFCQH